MLELCYVFFFFFLPAEEHWKIEPISKEEREAEQAKEAEQVCRNTMKYLAKAVLGIWSLRYLKWPVNDTHKTVSQFATTFDC